MSYHPRLCQFFMLQLRHTCNDTNIEKSINGTSSLQFFLYNLKALY